MDEIIVRVARAIACHTRLRILSLLAAEEEIAPSELAAKVGVRPDTMSVHLRRLADAGLILRRRSGRWSYCVGGSPYGDQTLSGQVSTWLRALFRDAGDARSNRTVGQLCDSSDSDPLVAVRALIFDAATAFANIRRMQILRRLEHGDALTADTLTRELHMSADAAYRHTAKLIRRGYLATTETERGLAYCLAADHKSPVHGRLWGIVRSVWRNE